MRHFSLWRMSTPHVVGQLLLKKAEVEAQIDSLNGRLSEAKTDLGHVVGAVRLFDPTAIVGPGTAYHGVTKTLKRSDLLALCRAALDASPEQFAVLIGSRHLVPLPIPHEVRAGGLAEGKGGNALGFKWDQRRPRPRQPSPRRPRRPSLSNRRSPSRLVLSIRAGSARR
jgi:hypothetical protein